MKPVTIALAWYTEAEWPAWVVLCPDFEPDRARWLAKMEAAKLAHAAKGITLRPLVLHPEKFQQWSREHCQGRLDTGARALYCTFRAAGSDTRRGLH